MEQAWLLDVFEREWMGNEGEKFEFKPNDVVEGYRVIQPLGEGAASEIYLVKDPRTQEVWALKHVHREGHKDTRFLDQAIHECEVASALKHPAIRRIERLIKQKKLLSLQAVILLMEFVDGISMEKQPPRHDLDLFLDLFIQACEGLKHMHDRGYVHADMKPNNIIVCDGNVAKIIDLGQSCKIGTVKERIQGTPDYIAPEQVHRRAITPKTDIYNIGASMYWVLTGNFIPTALAKSDALVSRVDDNLLDKPKPVTQFNAGVPQKLNDLILQCVEADHEKRPQHMGEVVDQLRLLLGLHRARNQRSSVGGGSGSPVNRGSPSSSGIMPSMGNGGPSGGSSGLGMRALNQGSKAGDSSMGSKGPVGGK